MLEGVGGAGREIGMVKVVGWAGGGEASTATTVCSECSVGSITAADAAGWGDAWSEESMAMVERGQYYRVNVRNSVVWYGHGIGSKGGRKGQWGKVQEGRGTR